MTETLRGGVASAVTGANPPMAGTSVTIFLARLLGRDSPLQSRRCMHLSLILDMAA